MAGNNSKFKTLQRYFLTGALTMVPLLVTWLLADFFLDLLRSFGEPVVAWAFSSVQSYLPREVMLWLMQPWFQAIMGIVLVIGFVSGIGWLATRYIGRRFLAFFDSIMDILPLVRNVYGSVKKLMDVMQTKPAGVQRVVLIDFPSKDMKTVGLVTRTLVDEDSGRRLAAVYIPTTPNPTSGYLEIVPLENVTPTDWTFDQAMTFIMSGGAVAPDKMNYDRNAQSEKAFWNSENDSNSSK